MNKSGKTQGGIARAQKLTPEERSAIAKNAATARWKNTVFGATHTGVITIGSLEIPCAVLEDGTRVISQRGMNIALGRAEASTKSRRKPVAEGAGHLPAFLYPQNLRPFISAELEQGVMQPIKYQIAGSGVIAFGFSAELLPKICTVWMKARDANVLKPAQHPTASAATIIVQGLAEVGIIALIDEATGFQYERERDALSKILDAFIAKELQPWLRTFPPEFYQHMFRLRGLPFNAGSVKRPQYFGNITNDIVYDRIAPGVREELQRGVPRNEAGRPIAKYFQKLTQNTGYPKLREHLGSVITLMKLSHTWDDFISKLDTIHPKYGTTLPLALNYKNEADSGNGL